MILDQLMEVQEAGLIDQARKNAGYEPVEEGLGGAILFTAVYVTGMVALLSGLTALEGLPLKKAQKNCRKIMKEYEEAHPEVLKYDDLTKSRTTRTALEHMERNKNVQSWLDCIYKKGCDELVAYWYKDDLKARFMWANSDPYSIYWAYSDAKMMKHADYYMLAFCVLEHKAMPTSVKKGVIEDFIAAQKNDKDDKKK